MGSILFTYQTVPEDWGFLQFYNWRWSFRPTARAKFLDSLHLIWMFEMFFFFWIWCFSMFFVSIYYPSMGWAIFGLQRCLDFVFFGESNTKTKCQRVNLVWKVAANAGYFRIPGLSCVHLLLAKDWNQEPFCWRSKKRPSRSDGRVLWGAGQLRNLTNLVKDHWILGYHRCFLRNPTLQSGGKKYGAFSRCGLTQLVRLSHDILLETSLFAP